MKLTSTCSARSMKLTIAFLNILFITLFHQISYAQTKIFAGEAIIKSNQIDDKDNATKDDNTFATVKSYGGLIGGAFKYSGELELKFPTDVPANRTTFIRIDFNADVLNALLGGNLGSSLADLVGTLVLGNHYFVVGARNSLNQEVAKGSSSGSFSATDVKLVKDAAGNFYVAITPSASYNRVYIKDVTDAALLGTSNSMKVYNAFYVSGSGNCDPAFATDFEGSGATLSLLGIGGAGVTNMQNAIDNNVNTASKMSLGLIAAAGTISQNIYFNSPSALGDEFNIRLSVDQALANVGLVNNIEVEAYNGNVRVYNTNLSTLLNLDLLGLLNSGQPTNIPFAPPLAFDRVKITLSSLLNVNLVQYISIYGVTRSAPRPTFTSPLSNSVNVCYNTSAALGATTAANNQLIWYNTLEGGTALATTAYNDTYNVGPLTANRILYVAAKRIGCTDESVRVPVNITVNPLLSLPATTFLNGTVGSAYAKQINAATGGTSAYTYALTAGSSLPLGLTLSNAGLVGGIPTQSGNYSFSVTATDNKGCTVERTYNLLITGTLSIAVVDLPNGTVGTNYPVQVIPLATGGSTPYTYTVTNLPPGLTYNSTTREVLGTPTVSGTYVVTVKVTDADGNSVTREDTIVIKNALSLPSAILADGTVNIGYLTQTIPSAEGGNTPYTYMATNVPAGLTFNVATREITGTPTVAGNFTITVQVSDAENKTVSTAYNIKIIEALSLPGKTLADGTVGAVYTIETFPAATGGVGPYTYVATNVPTGLTVDNSTRQLTGTPSQAGNYSITLTVTDAEGRSISNHYALKIIGALSLATAALPDGTVGQTYPTQVLPAVVGGTAPYLYVASNLPVGLNFNASTREVTGIPTLGGQYTFFVKVTDANSNTVNTNYTINIKVNAPIAANVTTCNGTSAALVVTNTQPGVTYNWYGATGNTPLVTGNNGTYNTASLNSNTVFYVEAVSGTAVSGRTAVNVTMNASPNLAVITTTNQTINKNQSATLRAVADAGNTINWYDMPTGGTFLKMGTEFSTPNLSGTTTYYVETVNASGCKSLSRTPVTVTVIDGGTGTDCNAANTQDTGINGICLLCNIAGPGNSTDADKNNFTRITLTVGVGATGYQKLIFPTTGLATDSISLDLATPIGLLDLTVLGGVTINVMNGTNIVKTYQLNSSLISLQLLGGNRFKATFLAGATFDRVEVRFQATVAALSSIDIYGAKMIYPRPTVTGNGQTICYDNPATLTAVPNGTTSIAWYDSATGGTFLGTNNTYTTSNLTTSTTYYIEISRNGCANPERMPVTVNVVPLLTVPVVTTAITSCEGSPIALSVNNPDASIVYKWYDAPTGGTELFTGATYNISALSSNKTYYVEATKSGCTSAGRAAIAVTVNSRPVLPQVQAAVSTINAGQTVVLTATSTDTDVDFNWFTSANAVTPIYTGATYITPPLSNTTSYYVEAKSRTSGCTSPSRVMITITVNNGGSPNPVPCEAAISESNGVTGIALLAGVSNAGLAIDQDTETGSTLFMPIGALNASVYQQLYFGSTSNVGDTIKVLLSSPGKLLSLNLLGSIQVSTLKGGVNNNDAVGLNNSLIHLELLSGNTQALVTFVPSQQFDAVEVKLNAGIVGALNSINVNYAQHVITAPEVTASSVIACLNQTTTLFVGNPKPNLTYKWYDAAGVYQAGKDGVSFVTPLITAATRFFVAASSPADCASNRTAVDVTLSPDPVAPELLSTDITTCANNSVVLQIKNPIVGITYKWYDGTGVYQTGKDGDSFTIVAVTANTTYSVEAVNNCNVTSPRTIINVKIGTLDAPIITSTSLSVSPNSGAVLSATSSTPNALIKWYANANDVIPLYTGSPYITAPLTITTTFFVEAEVPGGCASARIPVTVTVIPSGTPGITPCGTATEELANGVSNIAVLANVFNPGLAVDNKTETASSLVMPVGIVGAYVYQRVGFANGLSNIGDTIKVRLTSPGKLLSVGVLPSISVLTYNGNTANNDIMNANNPLIRVELLSDNSGATLSFVPSQQFDGVEVRLNSGLLSVLTSVDLNYVQRVGVAPQVEAVSLTNCQGASSLLIVKNPIPGVTYRWYLENVYQAGADGVNFTTPTSLAPGTYNYYVRALANGCESAPTKVVVTVSPIPAPPVPSPGNPVSTCVGTPATLGVVQVSGLSYNWYDSNGTLVASNTASYATPNNLAAGSYDYFVEAVNTNNCSNSAASRTRITISVGGLSLASDIQVSGNASACGTGTFVLTASSTTV
ncbi:putative Ig domain-containing protein, partial [Pedobacter sp. ASV28]|uniref:Ig-like domain-containing protein n=1 Tax=Pedobacter sp. ASV28 TaxID=2795123 RepID=UPI0018EC5ABA